MRSVLRNAGILETSHDGVTDISFVGLLQWSLLFPWTSTKNHLVELNLKRSFIEKKANHIFVMKIKILHLLLY